MTQIKECHKLPQDSAGYGGIRITCNSVCLRLEFEYWEGGDNWVGTVNFIDLAAVRFYDEFLGDFECHAYDVIFEVVDSPWRKTIVENTPKSIRGAEDKRHFAADISNNGTLEVIAERFEVLPSRLGILPRDLELSFE